MVQLGRIYVEMLQIYQLYSNFISQKVHQEGLGALNHVLLKYMRSARKQALQLVRIFVSTCGQEGLPLLRSDIS
jgi:hypothetical protein